MTLAESTTEGDEPTELGGLDSFGDGDEAKFGSMKARKPESSGCPGELSQRFGRDFGGRRYAGCRRRSIGMWGCGGAPRVGAMRRCSCR
jgi:hypothetical protein